MQFLWQLRRSAPARRWMNVVVLGIYCVAIIGLPLDTLPGGIKVGCQCSSENQANGSCCCARKLASTTNAKGNSRSSCCAQATKPTALDVAASDGKTLDDTTLDDTTLDDAASDGTASDRTASDRTASDRTASDRTTAACHFDSTLNRASSETGTSGKKSCCTGKNKLETHTRAVEVKVAESSTQKSCCQTDRSPEKQHDTTGGCGAEAGECSCGPSNEIAWILIGSPQILSHIVELLPVPGMTDLVVIPQNGYDLLRQQPETPPPKRNLLLASA